MRILWLTMQALPIIYKQIEPNKSIPPTGGWMEGISKEVIKNNADEFGYCFPYSTLLDGCVEGVRYYSYNLISDFHGYSEQDLERLRFIIGDFKPDVIHLFGTEHTHQSQLVHMVNKIGMIDRLVIWIQGLVSVYSTHYNAGLPESVIKARTTKEWIKRNNVNDMRNNMSRRGEEEIACLKVAKHVFVRTDWDEAACKAINPNLNIHFCNESLRSSFYEEPKWDISNVNRHTIFLSQANYPIKGLHMMIEALRIIKAEFPDAKVLTTGPDYLHYTTTVDRLRLSSYQKEIIRLLKKYDLMDSLIFQGILSEEHIRQQYLDAHVFVLPSSIENSPNSLGEAMLLGTPIVASDVGGVKNMMEHGVDGLLYPFDEPYVMAEYVCRLFRDDDLAVRYSLNAMKHAALTHSQLDNYRQLIKVYAEIIRE